MSTTPEVAPVFMEMVRCPTCGETFDLADGRLTCGRGHVFEISDEVPDLVHPQELLASDAEVQAKYDSDSESYDSGLSWMWKAFSADEDEVRSQLIDLLELEPRMRVLETGCGTGQDSWRILERIGDEGELFATDLSGGMLQVARRKLAAKPGSWHLLQSNASHLPFGDGAFDAAYHFGGINTFDERERAIGEMTRVVRPGGKVVFGDEGIAPWQREKLIGEILINANGLYAHTPPLDELPENALDVRLRWIISNAFYSVDYIVGEAPPPVDLDLPIPGKGDTLRSRYYGEPG